MKKILKSIVLMLVVTLLVTGCAVKTTKTSLEVVKVASHTAPMTDILELVKDDLKEAGYALELVKVSDNVQANVALNNKEVDANFFQHKLFMEVFNKGNNANLTVIQPIYDAIVAYYGKDVKNISEVKENAEVAIPSDPTNMTRALRLLATSDLIKLKDANSFALTLDDIVENPKNLKFTAVSLLNLNEAYQEKDLVFNYPAYAAKINLSPEANGLLLEKGNDTTFAISLVAREDNKNDAKIKALQKVLTSEKVKNFITEKLKGHAKVAF